MSKKRIVVVVSIVVVVIFCAIVLLQNRSDNMSGQFNEISAEHILVNSEAEANEILQEIKDKKISFEEAAKKNSKCPSGKNGGDLGYFGRGMMVKEFEDIAFSTESGKISQPVKTPFGWHLIKVIDRR